MATSGSTDFTMSRDEIIKDALLDVDGVSIYTDPTTNQITHASRRLNTMIKAWQGEQLFIHKKDTQTVTVNAQTESLAAGTVKVLSFWLRIDGTDVPLEVIQQKDYDEIISKAATGQPSKVYIEYDETSAPTAYFYPVPTESYAGYYRRSSLLEDFDAAGNTPDLPVQACDLLVKGLAYELSVPYGLNAERVGQAYSRYKDAKLSFLSYKNQESSCLEPIAPKGVMIV